MSYDLFVRICSLHLNVGNHFCNTLVPEHCTVLNRRIVSVNKSAIVRGLYMLVDRDLINYFSRVVVPALHERAYILM